MLHYKRYRVWNGATFHNVVLQAAPSYHLNLILQTICCCYLNSSKNTVSVDVIDVVIICVYDLFVCVEVLRPCQQLRSCRAGQLPINTVPGLTST